MTKSAKAVIRLLEKQLNGRAMAQAVRRQPPTAEARVRSRGHFTWDLWWTKWHWDRFFPSTYVFPCQFHSTGAPLLVKLKNKLIIFIKGLHKKP
jgi:hypothetical protein